MSDKSHRIWKACLAVASATLFAVLVLGSRLAAAQEALPSAMSLAAATAQRFPQPVRVGDLINRTVLEPKPDRPMLGHVIKVVRASNGGVRIVIEYGGTLGFGARAIAVPADAIALLGTEVVVMDYTPKQLDGLPSYSGNEDVPIAPGETIRMGLASPSH